MESPMIDFTDDPFEHGVLPVAGILIKHQVQLFGSKQIALISSQIYVGLYGHWHRHINISRGSNQGNRPLDD